jgi:hypothetical protein
MLVNKLKFKLVNIILLSGILLAIKYLQLYSIFLAISFVDYYSLYCPEYKTILSN